MKKRTPKWQIGGWGPSRLSADDMGPPRQPRNTQRGQRLALEKKLADAGVPRRRGRRAEQEYQRRVKKERRAEADRPRRPGVPRPRPRPSSRTREARLGKPHRVIIVALCSLPSCPTLHTQRRPQWQTTGAPGETGAYNLKSMYNAYCCTEHRIEAWRLANRQHDEGITCEGPECEVWVPRTPGPGRPSDYHEPRCKRRAYRARVAARRASAAGE